jgi:eukaryotic-like serine/threonine-protein kinase
MSNPYAIGTQRPPDQAPSDSARPKGTAGGSARRRQLALVGESGQHITSEIDGLLRRRLRIAALITLTAFAVFLVRGVIDRGHYYGSALELSIHASVVGIFTVLTCALWSSWRLSLGWLRGIELLLFGTAAAFFLWLQFVVFRQGKVLDLANPAVADSGERVLRLAASGHGLRWFSLIVIYGVFIPNTWRRCALVVGLMALTPLVLTGLTCTDCARLGSYTGQVLLDLTIVLGMASAIAVFGSYKISELRQEALEARKLGQYVLKRKLGRGGMGEVYLGEHILLRRACAIKLIRPDQAGDRTNLSRFEREVKAMATLTHWNAVEIYDYGHAEDGTFYYVMEYLPGLSLQQLVERHGPLPPERAVHFLQQLCGALAEAHSTGLIHRDLKPSNVIAAQRGGIYDVAKLLDFGLVHSLGPAVSAGDQRLTVQGTILGSPPYMAPEQALGKDALDARTDIYSLGALAYFLLSGQAPFVRETAMQTLVAHVHETPPHLRDLRPEVPADLADVVMRCLEKDPAARYQDADSLDEALAECECAGLWGKYEARLWWQRNNGKAVHSVTADPMTESIR